MKQTKNKQNKTYKLTVYNNDNVSFNDIIFIFKSLGHATLQAEQCASIIHNKGKYNMIVGNYNELVEIQLLLTNNNIQSEIISERTKTKKPKSKI
jgi:ATP-dependent Clp protease adaptor protein ClpS